MNIDVNWGDEEKTFLLYSSAATWNWEDLNQAVAKAHTLLNEVDHPVDSIIDLRKSRFVPPNPLRHGSRMGARATHAYSGRVVFVGASLFASTMFQMLCRVRPHLNERFQFATTMEEARALLIQPEPA